MKHTTFRFNPLVAALLAATTLCGCAPLIIGGAVAGGAMMVTDRRTTGVQIEDQAIEFKASKRVRELMPDRGHINATSFNRHVLITGEAPTDADKAAVVESISKVENVRSVVDEVAVMPPSSFGTRSNDSLLTTKVKATLVDAKDILANAFKIVTERGTVYLMGRVSEREANRAADVARSVSGVQKVVKVFDLISEEELAGVTEKSAPKR